MGRAAVAIGVFSASCRIRSFVIREPTIAVALAGWAHHVVCSRCSPRALVPYVPADRANFGLDGSRALVLASQRPLLQIVRRCIVHEMCGNVLSPDGCVGVPGV